MFPSIKLLCKRCQDCMSRRPIYGRSDHHLGRWCSVQRQSGSHARGRKQAEGQQAHEERAGRHGSARLPKGPSLSQKQEFAARVLFFNELRCTSRRKRNRKFSQESLRTECCLHFIRSTITILEIGQASWLHASSYKSPACMIMMTRCPRCSHDAWP